MARRKIYNEFMEDLYQRSKNQFEFPDLTEELYNSSEWKGSSTRVKRVCKKCGFEKIVSIDTLRRGGKCSMCEGNERLTFDILQERVSRLKNLELAINREWFDENYKNTSTRVPVKCLVCGDIFEKRVENLIRPSSENTTCRKCINKNISITQAMTREEFIKKAMKIHNIEKHKDYSYELITEEWWKKNYINYNIKNKDGLRRRTTTIKLPIICPKHGIFYITLSSHLQGSGCLLCNSSKGEEKIHQFLEECGIKFEKEKTFNNLKYKNKLRFDFYLPEYNLLIEFDGRQHFEEAGGYHKNTLKETQLRDQMKNIYCQENNINLLRIPYTEIGNIKKLIFNKIIEITKN